MAVENLADHSTAGRLQLMKCAPRLRDALTILVATCRRMDCEVQAHRPSEEEYQAALAVADAVLTDLSTCR